MSRRHSVPNHSGHSLSGLGHAIASVPGVLLAWADRSRTRNQLLGLDDRMLKDIGLSRAQADEEARKPFWRR